jgi:hypothetical protein
MRDATVISSVMLSFESLTMLRGLTRLRVRGWRRVPNYALASHKHSKLTTRTQVGLRIGTNRRMYSAEDDRQNCGQ